MNEKNKKRASPPPEKLRITLSAQHAKITEPPPPFPLKLHGFPTVTQLTSIKSLKANIYDFNRNTSN